MGSVESVHTRHVLRQMATGCVQTARMRTYALEPLAQVVVTSDDGAPEAFGSMVIVCEGFWILRRRFWMLAHSGIYSVIGRVLTDE